MPNFHRVVITGIGAVTPIGNNIDEYLVGLQKGTNGVSDITLYDPEQHPCRFAAEVKNLQSENFIEAKESKRWDRFSQFGVIAAKQAFNDSGLEITEDNQITEYMLANLVPKLWPAENPIMLSASSPIRDWLTFSENGTLTRNCFSFRGASGIDGTLSLALGISRFKNPLLLVTGDLAFIHDINGWLIENSIDVNLTIL